MADKTPTEGPSFARTVARDPASDLYRPEDPGSRAAFERARQGEAPREHSRPPERPPQLTLPDPKPSFEQRDRKIERLWFSRMPAPEPLLSREEFIAMRTAPKARGRVRGRKMSKR